MNLDLNTSFDKNKARDSADFTSNLTKSQFHNAMPQNSLHILQYLLNKYQKQNYNGKRFKYTSS